MTPAIIDTATFTELQDTAGAEFAAELVGTFLEEAPEMLAELRAARGEGAVDRFRRAAHSLKSNSQTFGATELAALARELELGGMPTSDTPLLTLEAAYTRAAQALRDLSHG